MIPSIFSLLCLFFAVDIQSAVASGIGAIEHNCLRPQMKWNEVLCDLVEKPIYEIDFVNRSFIRDGKSSWYEFFGLPVRKDLIMGLKQKVAEENLSECQVAALVKCITASFLTYDDQNDPMDRMYLSEIYSKATGRCRQYATVYKDLADAVGIRTVIASGSDDNGQFHAFNAVMIDGHWYHLEPQSKSRKFYRLIEGSVALDFLTSDNFQF